MTTVGILAYGSVISDPRAEISVACTGRIKVKTPFNVEFARSSNTRDGAPTLVPVKDGGAPVDATIIVVNVSAEEASSMLWRRETDQVREDKKYNAAKKFGPNRVKIERHEFCDS